MKQGFFGSMVTVALLCVTNAHANGFQGVYAPTSWVSSGISGGTADVDLATSNAAQLVLTYNVSLSGGGVSYRTAEFTAVADFDGPVSFDWDYTFNHRWYRAEQELTFFAYDASGNRQEVPGYSGTRSGSGSASGAVTNLIVSSGQVFGVEVGGSNFDSNSVIEGTVTLTNLVYSATDCNGVPNGPAEFDMCGVCDDDPTNDCVQDCNGEWGGPADLDMCGVCDDDPFNDCVEDCDGEWGGPAVLDMCGICDDDPTNDCVEDCAGTWGGTAVVDMCGSCDDDPTNDCVEDCEGTWGGSATVDQCGVCDDDPENDCVEDCAGVLDGLAVIDACGECSGGNTGSAPVYSADDCLTSRELGCGCAASGSATSSALGVLALGVLLGRRRRESV